LVEINELVAVNVFEDQKKTGEAAEQICPEEQNPLNHTEMEDSPYFRWFFTGLSVDISN